MSKQNTVEILNVEQIFNSKYVVPLYQRNFAWGEEQICQLLQDIYESIKVKDQQYFIGSLVTIRRQDDSFEVIDGQQRLTILALLSYVLQFNVEHEIHYDSRPEKVEPEIHYDSRPEVERFLQSLASGVNITSSDPSTSHFSAAIETIKEQIVKIEKAEAGTEGFKETFRVFVLNNVCLVREIMPEDTDVAAYFEIMNNRGEQLQEHEIVKGLLLGKLKDNPKLSKVCATIWDACSQMDERVQKSFDTNIRKALFGENYNSFLKYSTFKDYLSSIDSEGIITDGLNLDEILNGKAPENSKTKSEEEDIPEADREESIIDFPNFLMHVMKLYYNDKIKGNKEIDEIRLHDKYLLKTFRLIEDDIDATEFFYRLLKCRTVFDRYVVKANFVKDDDEKGREWSLLRPYKDTDTRRNRSQLRFRNTFEKKQDMIIKAVSCIQVSHPSKYYKNYLQTLLRWFKDSDSIDISEDVYLERLNGYIYDDLKNLSNYFEPKDYTPELQGTSTSHAALDYIDYLIWNIKDRNITINGEEQEWSIISKLKDFRFQYWNSVEHHYPQKRKEELAQEGVDDFLLNCLGNIFLIGKSTNSRLSDKNPKDKALMYNDNSNLAPNRQLIYKITQNGWGKQQIESHLRFIQTVFKNAHRILRVKENKS